MAYRAVIFDLFGTLVESFSLTKHRRVLTEMAQALEAPADPFIRHWFDTFDQRCTGVFKSVEENILHVCRRVSVTPRPEQVEQARRLRLGLTERYLRPRSDAVQTLSSEARVCQAASCPAGRGPVTIPLCRPQAATKARARTWNWNPHPLPHSNRKPIPGDGWTSRCL